MSAHGDEYDDLIYNSSSSEKELDSSEEETILANLYYLDDNKNIKTLIAEESDSQEHIVSENGTIHNKSPDASNPNQNMDNQERSDEESDSRYSFLSKTQKIYKSSNGTISPKKHITEDSTLADLKFSIPVKLPGLSTEIPISDLSSQKRSINQVLELDSSKKDLRQSENESDSQESCDSGNSYSYLDAAEYSGKGRYYMEKKEKICRSCKKGGHIAKDCPIKLCAVCGLSGHPPNECKSQATVCHNCNQRGHISSNCPKPIERYGPSRCYRCDSRYHHSEECPTIWRNYNKFSAEKTNPESVSTYCYNCASDNHFGDECTRNFPYWAVYEDNTAFTISNLDTNISGSNKKSNQHNKHKSYDHYTSDSEGELQSKYRNTDTTNKMFQPHNYKKRGGASNNSSSKHSFMNPSAEKFIKTGINFRVGVPQSIENKNRQVNRLDTGKRLNSFNTQERGFSEGFYLPGTNFNPRNGYSQSGHTSNNNRYRNRY